MEQCPVVQIISDIESIQTKCWAWRAQGATVALVPTMGYFHAGHISLMSWARDHTDKVVVSLFVNPTQFGPGEDLEAYPRDPERDAAMAREAGVDALFAPDTGAMYAPESSTWVGVEGLDQRLCGRSRPGHFRGVATVVAKLFNLTAPHLAVFGRKDWQQLVIVRRMARDLNFPTQVVGRPTVREHDGLAVSSRNVYLDPHHRAQAPNLYRGLQLAASLVEEGLRRSDEIRARVRDFYGRTIPDGEEDYLELVHPGRLEPMEELEGEAVLAVAYRLGKARLIDNIRISLDD
jgi:pantoate--beta-alanine ligase